MAAKTVAQLVQEAKKDIENLTPEEVEAELAAGGVTLIDLRDQSELVHGSIPGSLHLPRGMLEFRADPTCSLHDERLEPQQRTIVYCAGGGRSALAVHTLRELGYRSVAHLDGGFFGWQKAGKPTE